jgi:predicted enzyme related to lactoylglutathione lyase
MNVRRDAQNAGRRRTTMKNSVVHFEIYADDVDRLEQFYKGLFDWTIESPPGMDYHMIKTVDTGADNRPVAGGINGGMLKRPAGYGVSAWVSYVNVESLDRSVARAKELGAKVTKDKSAVPGMGWFAMLTDPQGTDFALWQTDSTAK